MEIKKLEDYTIWVHKTKLYIGGIGHDPVITIDLKLILEMIGSLPLTGE